MIRRRKGIVLEIIRQRENYTEFWVEIEGKKEKAINYDWLTGSIEIGIEVLLNTTAVHLGLGTGGRHFVMQIVGQEVSEQKRSGHIMKLRYTPLQVQCLSVEEERSPHREKIEQFRSLDDLPVVICTLHSMVPLVAAAYFLASRGKNLVYIMTDGAALPLAFSELIARLKEKGLLMGTVTIGHAFGGDLEAVNVYTGLIAAKEVLQADCIVVAMGPGIVGTGTTYGFTGVEQGELVNAVNLLGGRALAVPRISFADIRERHYGISHHTLTALGQIALTRAIIPLPEFSQEKRRFVWKQLKEGGILQKHSVIERECTLEANDYLKQQQIYVTTMGRSIEQDREFFQTCFLAGKLASK